MNELQLANKLDSYREGSPYLFGPFTVRGYCQPDYVREGKVIRVWGDFAAPVHTGDLVVAFLLTPSGAIQVLGKRIERTRDGRAWLYAWATREPNSMFAMPIDSPLLRIIAIAAVVAELYSPGEASLSDNGEGRAVLDRYGHISRVATAEWREQGFLPRVRIGIANDPRSVSQLRRELQL